MKLKPVKQRERIRLRDREAARPDGLQDDDELERRMGKLSERLETYQAALWAESRRALLVVFQARDAGGKDGVIKRVFGPLNPQGTYVASFKAPTEDELAHDYLWRVHHFVPQKGYIGIFNRSHYEEVVTVRVHPEQLATEGADPAQARDERFWQARLDAICAWERHLVASGTRVVKLFLNVSKEEQRERLLARARDPQKLWKFVPDDVAQRAYWEDYQRAYEAALRATSTADAPWYVIPADHKWFARAAIGEVVVHHLREMDPRPPALDEEQRRAALEALGVLEEE
jgi:PPK2 family polyphosphate:nucleotide phosphotransferase